MQKLEVKLLKLLIKWCIHILAWSSAKHSRRLFMATSSQRPISSHMIHRPMVCLHSSSLIDIECQTPQHSSLLIVTLVFINLNLPRVTLSLWLLCTCLVVTHPIHWLCWGLEDYIKTSYSKYFENNVKLWKRVLCTYSDAPWISDIMTSLPWFSLTLTSLLALV